MLLTNLNIDISRDLRIIPPIPSLKLPTFTRLPQILERLIRDPLQCIDLISSLQQLRVSE